MSKYTYLIDLNSVNKLTKHIKNSLSDISHITYDNITKNVDIYFSSYLTSGEKTTLDNLISTFPNNNEDQVYMYQCHCIPKKKINTNSYTLISSLIYEGSEIEKILGIFYFSSFKNTSENFTYSVRLWDSTNKLVIAEITGLSNTLQEIISSTDLDNIPTNKSLIEFQCKLSEYNKYGVIFTSLNFGYL